LTSGGSVIGQGRQFITPGEGMEVWISQIAGQIGVEITRDRGRNTRETVIVPGYGRLRISEADRILAMELCIVPEVNCFTNGMLVREDADQNADVRTMSIDALTADQLVKIFSFSGRKFENEVNKLGEIPIRRMLEMSDDVDASVSQVAYLNKQIAERWPVGGDMPSNREARAVRSQPE